VQKNRKRTKGDKARVVTGIKCFVAILGASCTKALEVVQKWTGGRKKLKKVHDKTYTILGRKDLTCSDKTGRMCERIRKTIRADSR